MPGNARQLTIAAERAFPVRIRIAVPAGGFGQTLNAIHAWLDDNCGADGWATAGGGVPGYDMAAFYFRDAAIAAAFAARWCAGGAPAVENGAFLTRPDAPKRRSEMPHYGWGGPAAGKT